MNQEELEADLAMTRQERDSYRNMLEKMVDATLEFADAFGPIIPAGSRGNWDAHVANIRQFQGALKSESARKG